MRHVDDGTLNAWLDGALPPGDAAAVAVHLEHCEACRSHLGEAEHWRHAADRLLASAAPGDVAAPSFQHVLERASVYPSPALRPVTPYHPGEPLRALPAWATVAWAATILLALAVGYYAGEVYRPARQQRDESGRLQSTATTQQATPATSAPVGAAAPAAPPAQRSTPVTIVPRDLAPPDPRRLAAAEEGAPAAPPAPERLAQAQEPAAHQAEGAAAAAGGRAAQTSPAAAAPSAVWSAAPPELLRAPSAYARNLIAPSNVLDAAGNVSAAKSVAAPAPGLTGLVRQRAAEQPSDVPIWRVDSTGVRRGGITTMFRSMEAAPGFTPYTVRPRLLNEPEVRLAVLRFYPPLEKGAGVEGAPLLWALVDTAGRVKRTQVKSSSGVPSLDQAAQQVASVMRFSPGLYHDARVEVWIQVPVAFKPTP